MVAIDSLWKTLVYYYDDQDDCNLLAVSASRQCSWPFSKRVPHFPVWKGTEELMFVADMCVDAGTCNQCLILCTDSSGYCGGLCNMREWESSFANLAQSTWPTTNGSGTLSWNILYCLCTTWAPERFLAGTVCLPCSERSFWSFHHQSYRKLQSIFLSFSFSLGIC